MRKAPLPDSFPFDDDKPKPLSISGEHNVQLIHHLEDGIIEIMNHDGKNKITVRNPRIPIQVSGPQKYSELEELNKQILSMTVVPDFGYQEKTYGDESVAGWRLLYDYVKKSPKMIKL